MLTIETLPRIKGLLVAFGVVFHEARKILNHLAELVSAI